MRPQAPGPHRGRPQHLADRSRTGELVREAREDTFDDVEALTAATADMITVATAEGVYRYISPASRRLFRWDPDEMIGRHQEQFAHPDDVQSMRSSEESSLVSDRFYTMTYRLRCGDDTYRWIEATYHRVESAGDTFVVGSVRDIAERKEKDVLLQQRASTDPLTGVANRSVLMDRLQQALHRLDRAPGILAVLFLDLDRFKVVNDSLGHRIGDGVLMSMAERLRGSSVPPTRWRDWAATSSWSSPRTCTDGRGGRRWAQRITEAGREPFEVGDGAVRVHDQRGHRRDHRPAAQRPRACCRRRTWRCTGRRTAAATGPRSSTRTCEPSPWAGSAPSACCAGPSTSIGCGSVPADHRPPHGPRRSGPRRWCGSGTRSAGVISRRPSSRSPRRPGCWRRSTTGSSTHAIEQPATGARGWGTRLPRRRHQRHGPPPGRRRRSPRSVIDILAPTGCRPPPCRSRSPSGSSWRRRTRRWPG